MKNQTTYCVNDFCLYINCIYHKNNISENRITSGQWRDFNPTNSIMCVKKNTWWGITL